MDCREQSTVAICSEMDSEWVYCSAPESGIQLLADTINHCCPGWSSAHTTTATTSADDEQGEEDELDKETGQRSTWANGDRLSKKLDKVEGRWWIDY